MKKIIISVLIILLMLFINNSYLNYLDKYYTKKLNSIYCDNMGNEFSVDKNQGEILQKKLAQGKDNLLILGSSELGMKSIPQHPVNVFKNKRCGFQINIIGRGHCQDFVHAMDLLAMSDSYRNKKAVFIISPQWFDRKGLIPIEFNMNFSELQFYSIMFNKNIDYKAKLKVASRVNELLKGTKDYYQDKVYSFLYSKNNFFTKILLDVISPYYMYKHRILCIKDKQNSYNAFLKKYKNKRKDIEPRNVKIDWDKELLKSENDGKTNCTNNDFGMSDSFYNEYAKPNLKRKKNSNMKSSYLKSPEYDDLYFLLETAKKLNMKIQFISIPVNGFWYDYTGFSKLDREKYYKKVKDIITSYGFPVEDYSKNEYEKYFFCDTIHIGWKGWARINKVIYNFYYQN